jgi:hypothetical protein
LCEYISYSLSIGRMAFLRILVGPNPTHGD